MRRAFAQGGYEPVAAHPNLRPEDYLRRCCTVHTADRRHDLGGGAGSIRIPELGGASGGDAAIVALEEAAKRRPLSVGTWRPFRVVAFTARAKVARLIHA